MEYSKYGDYGPMMQTKIKMGLIKRVRGYVYVHFIEEDDQFDWIVNIIPRFADGIEFNYKKKNTNVGDFDSNEFVDEIIRVYKRWVDAKFFRYKVEDNNNYGNFSRKENLYSESVPNISEMDRKS